MNRFVAPLGFALASLLCWTSPTHGDRRDDIGWTQLFTEKGGTLENGAGVLVSMTEAPGDVGGTLYLPNLASSQFTGKTIIDGSGNAAGSTTHATNVATFFFGNTGSIANGVTSITAYEANDWINNRMGFASGADPVAQNFRVQNHSWIGNDADDVAMRDILQRVDFVVNRDDVTIVAGSSNGGAIPDLLVHAYNVISVGRTDGLHGAGNTRFYGNGRSRPDLVAPQGATSFSTPLVSAAASILHQKGAGTDGVRSQSIRAILMAGATKDEFVGSWDQTPSRRLDEVYGAGELNIYNSYRIMEAGQFTGSIAEPIASIGDHGWDYQDVISPLNPVYYDFEIGVDQAWDDLSVILAWNIDVTDLNPDTGTFAPSVSLADMSLDLFDSTGSFLANLLETSNATVGNVEHLYIDRLLEGRYTLRVSSNRATSYALAWRATAIPEPAVGFLLIVLMGLALLGHRPRLPANGRTVPVHAE